ncbi:MAG: hypothetical protein HYY17_06025 [Planctomycetes bacterium]|nr:hypothetical protein [Planctomycetota bacterium]
MKWLLAVAVVAALAIAVAEILRLRGCGGGLGLGGGTAAAPSGGPSENAYFVVTVAGSAIRVDGRDASAEEAVRAAKQDGRPVMVVWERAYTDAENALKGEMLRRGVEIACEKTVRP